MPTAFFITHPEVVVDPNVPVPQWKLSGPGIARMKAFASSPRLANVAAIWSSAEVKAVEAAGILAAKLHLTAAIDPELHENDRSATGFLPPPEFERVADTFFASPHDSVRGWEKAIDAQARVVGAVSRILKSHAQGDIAIVAHGGVGTLLQCYLAGEAITRSRDQRSQGHVFAFDLATRKLVHGWKKLEEY
jgi:broad specificity phosphatase PhoE